MSKWLKLISLTVGMALGASTVLGQNMPTLNMGFSGAGIGSDLLKVIGRNGLWRKHGIDVRTIYLSSGTLMAQTLSSGDIGIAGFDTPGGPQRQKSHDQPLRFGLGYHDPGGTALLENRPG
jgi:hypothetical protein